MKKIILLVLLFSFALVSCAKKEKETPMDKLSKDGYYHYHNKDLNFSLTLPKEFIYYQTQREETNNYIDIEFFVPTSDTNYLQKVPGYGEAIVVRVFVNDKWDKILEEAEDGLQYKVVKRDGKKIYTIKFWKRPPKDWEKKWNRKMEDEIKNSFKLEEKS